MSDARLDHFVQAQAGVIDAVMSELGAGRKRTHWMWFVFPQLAALGRSATARFYGLASLDEARTYADPPVLGPRLRECTRARRGRVPRGAGRVLRWRTGRGHGTLVRMRTHPQLDARSLAMHRLVADRIRRDPALLAHVRQTLARWRGSVSVNTLPYLDEWERIVAQGVDACLAVALEESERATALRQSSPFTGILTHQERFAFLKEWRERHEA